MTAIDIICGDLPKLNGILKDICTRQNEINIKRLKEMSKMILESKRDVVFSSDPTYIKLFDAPFNEAAEGLVRPRRDNFIDRMSTGLGEQFNIKSEQPINLVKK